MIKSLVRLRGLVGALVLLLGLGPVPAGLTAGFAAARADLPPLIPRTVLFGNPERTTPRLSPDGTWLAYLAPDANGVLQVWLQPAEGGTPRVVTADPKRGIRSFLWRADARAILYLQDSDGDENFHLYTVDLATNAVHDLTPFPGVQAFPIAYEPDRPTEMLVAMNQRDPRLRDVYRLDLEGGTLTPVAENPGTIASWVADRRLQVRAATALTPDGGGALLVRDTPEAEWRPLRRWGPDDEIDVVAFAPNGRSLWVASNVDANTARLLALDLTSGAETVIASDPTYDVTDTIIQPRTGVLQAVGFQRARLEWQVLDPSIAADFDQLQRLRRGDIRIVSRTLDDRTWLVAYLSDDAPVYYYTYHRSGKASTATLLFSNRPELERYTLARMEPISLTSRDGLTLNGYLTLPVGLPPRNLPVVLLVHGGPQARDVWGFDPEVQWLANRGYAVLQINFRGSTGYGKAFTNAGNGEWGAKMHDDLIDGVNWLIAQGIADPARIGIMGGSYGGYATLVGLTMTPDVFAVGVDIVGPSNLITLLNSLPPYWEVARAQLERRVGGSLEKDAAFLQSRSPLFFVDRITKPLLIGQGANDPRVKQAESEQMVQAMRSAGKPVEYVLYPDEGHGFARPENRLHFYAIAEVFLARYLGGRAEPIGEIKGTSGIVNP